jgi:predicted ribosome-associated RNA-binding protein Tma20
MRKMTLICLAAMLTFSLFSQEKNHLFTVNEQPDLIFEPAQPIATPVYVSNFENDADGWTVVNQEGASSSLSVKDGKLALTVISGGSKDEHLQVMRAGILLEKGQVYRMSYTITSNWPTGTCFMGRNAEPWDAYSEYKPASTIGHEEESLSYIFTMEEDTDPDARFAFNLGMMVGVTTVIGEATFSNIRIDKLEYPTAIAEIEQKDRLQLYFTSGQLCFFNENDYTQIRVFCINGKLQADQPLTAGYNEIDASHLASGIYIVVLNGKGKNTKALKVFKCK